MGDIFDDLKTTMRYNNQSQHVIARNIARANIPHEKAFTLPPLKLDQNSNRNIKMVKTSNYHLESKHTIGQEFKPEKSKNTAETEINGNNIDLVEQSELMRQVAIDNKTAIEAYKKYNSMMRTAISSK